MYIIYYYVPSDPEERGDEADIFVSFDGWRCVNMYRSECVWLVPGTIDMELEQE